jgi:hypothetical protein
MRYYIATVVTAIAITLTPLAAWSQSNATGQSGEAANRDSPTMPKAGKVQKETDPEKNGTSQSQSRDGMNKNGQPQK